LRLRLTWAKRLSPQPSRKKQDEGGVPAHPVFYVVINCDATLAVEATFASVDAEFLLCGSV